jgi:hypothetical protein
MFKDGVTRFKVIAMLAILSSALMAAVAKAAPPDTSSWNCQFCPFESGYQAKVSAGGSYVSDDAADFGDASGYDEKGGYLNVDGEGSYASDNYQLSWYAEDLGLDSRMLEIEGGRQGSFGFNLSYRELPERVFDTTSSVFLASGPHTLSLPGSWVPAPLTSGMTALTSSLSSQNVESDRQIIEFGASYLPSSRIRLFADYRQQQKDGVDIFGASTFSQASLLLRPLDYQTDEVDLLPEPGDRSGLGQSVFVRSGHFSSGREPGQACAGTGQPFPAGDAIRQLRLLANGYHGRLFRCSRAW